MAVNMGDEHFNHSLPKMMLVRLEPVPVAGHDDDKRRGFSRSDQQVSSLVSPQAIPLVIGGALPVK